MNNKDIEWGFVVGFALMVLYGIWTYFTFKRKIPFFDTTARYGFFNFETFIGGLGVSLVTLAVVLGCLIIVLGSMILLFMCSKETYRACHHGIDYLTGKLKSRIENVKNKKSEGGGKNA